MNHYWYHCFQYVLAKHPLQNIVMSADLSPKAIITLDLIEYKKNCLQFGV